MRHAGWSRPPPSLRPTKRDTIAPVTGNFLALGAQYQRMADELLAGGLTGNDEAGGRR
jgi:hypothetical protein